MKNIILICSLLTLISCETPILGEKSIDPVQACPAIYKPSPLRLSLNLQNTPSSDFELTLNDVVMSETELCPDQMGGFCINSEVIDGNNKIFTLLIPMHLTSVNLVYSEEGTELVRRYDLKLMPTAKANECFGDYEVIVTE